MYHQKLCVIAVSLACATLSSTAAAAPKDELAEIRQQIQAMKAQYESRIAELEKKLNQAETRVEKTEQTASRAEAAIAKVSNSPSRSPQQSASAIDTSLILQGQFASMKDIDERGITGFLPAGHDHGATKRGFSAQHTELIVSGNIDPYWRGKAIFALNHDQSVEVEEASFQRTGSDLGIGFKGGRFRSGIGYLNEQHPHYWDFADAPLAYKALFGNHGAYTQEGVQFKWLAPLDSVALTFGAEAGRGVSFPATARNKNRQDSSALFAKLGGDVGVSNSWQAGVSYLRTSAADRDTELEVSGTHTETPFTGKSQIWLADFVWKWAPNGNPSYQNFKFQTEYFQRKEDGSVLCDDTNCSGNYSGTYRAKQSGWYAQAVYQFMPRWRVGYRIDQLNSGTPYLDFAALNNEIDPANAALQRYKPHRDSIMMDYSWTEFSRVRLQFAQDKSMDGIRDNQMFLQYIMSLGAHGAHKF